MRKFLPKINNHSGVVFITSKNICRQMSRFLIAMLCGLFILPVLTEDVSARSKKFKSAVNEFVQRTSVRGDFKKRRDPFRPIRKRRSASTVSRKSHSLPLKIIPISERKNPNWKLLGIIDGRYERQAVIQVSPQERVFVRSGLEVGRSGWIIKTISKGEVLLERSFPPTSRKGHTESQVFSLAFVTLKQSS